jgi:hypothetical protein
MTKPPLRAVKDENDTTMTDSEVIDEIEKNLSDS